MMKEMITDSMDGRYPWRQMQMKGHQGPYLAHPAPMKHRPETQSLQQVSHFSNIHSSYCNILNFNRKWLEHIKAYENYYNLFAKLITNKTNFSRNQDSF